MESCAFLSPVPKLRFDGFGLHPSQFGSSLPKHRLSGSQPLAQSRRPQAFAPSLSNPFLGLPQDLSSSLLVAKQFDGLAIRTKRQQLPSGVSCARDGCLAAPPWGGCTLGKLMQTDSRSGWTILPSDTALPRSWKQGRKIGESLLEDQLSRSCRCRDALRDGSRVVTAAQDFLYEKGTLLIRALAFVGTVFLLGIATLYGQAKAQSYVQKHILPPVAAMVSAYLARDLDLGKVQRVSPLGLTLESCSVGPHEEEFSCGQLPNVEIRIRPFASIQRQQIVVDAVLVQPNLLVSQRKDWTWLGIPTPMDKSYHRTSSEEGLDARTKARRLSRERISAQLAEERHQAARKSAKLGYTLQNGQINGEDSTSEIEEMHRRVEFGTAVSASTTSGALWESVDDGPIRTPIKLGSRRSSHSKALFDGDWYDPDQGGLENEENYRGSEEEITMDEALVFGRSLVDCRMWLDKYFVKPVRLFKNWSEKSASQRAELQRRNLDLSAAAARAYFDKVDNTQRAEESGEGQQQEEDLEHIKYSPKPSVIVNQNVSGEGEDSSDANTDGNLAQMKIIRFPSPEKVTQNSGHLEEFPTNNSLKEGHQDSNLSEEENFSLPETSRQRDMTVFLEEPKEMLKSEVSFEGDDDYVIQANTEEDYRDSAKGVIIQEDLAPNNRTCNIHGGKLAFVLKEQFVPKDSIEDNVNGKTVCQIQSTTSSNKNVILEGLGKGMPKERPSNLQASVGKLTVLEDGKRSIHEALVNAIRERHWEASSKEKQMNLRIYDNAGAVHGNQPLPSGEISRDNGLPFYKEGEISSCFEGQSYDGSAEGRMTCSLETIPKNGGADDEIPRATHSPNLCDGATAVRNNQCSQDHVRESVLGQNSSSDFASLSRQPTGRGIKSRAEALANKLVAQAKRNLKAAPLQKWLPVTLETVYFRGGTLMLLAYGDQEPRVMENINGYLKLENKYEKINVHVAGRLKDWRSTVPSRDGGNLLVKVFVDVRQQMWHVKLKGHNLHAPLLERLLEIPVNWSTGRANGELHVWATKGEQFPKFSGRLKVNNLGFQIWEAPSAFKEVSGTLFFQGQRMFLHNTSGFFGAIPLNVSGDMDLNPEYGEYRLVCQVSNVEVNALMKTLKARPPLFPLAGALKAAVYCRGPLEVPVFAGTAEISKKDMDSFLYRLPSVATEAIRQKEDKGAAAAFDRIPFSYASANFTFDIDNCIADLYGIRATLADGGEIRGAGNMWICPEGELDSTAVNIDLSGQVFFDSVIQNYLPVGWKAPPVSLDFVHGEAKVRGSLLRPVFDIKWNAPDAKGSFNDVRGDINISHEAIIINSSALTFDLWTKIHTLYPPLPARRENRLFDYSPPEPPKIEGLEFDVKMRGFDFLGLAPSSAIGASSPIGGMHMKVTGRAKFQGRVVKLQKVLENDLSNGVNDSIVSPVSSDQHEDGTSGIVGEILLSGLRLNQLLVAPHLTGSLDIFPSSFKLNALGRADEHLLLEFSSSLRQRSLDKTSTVNLSSMEARSNLVFFSLERGQLRTNMRYEPGHSAKLEVRNLQLDELELASLRGVVQKAEMQLNFHKRRGQGSLSVRRPRFSGVQGESLDLSGRWSGDVITIEKSVLEQASSHYELQGEYVLPGPRDHVLAEKERGDGAWKSAMAGQLGNLITSMGRWRLRLEVPGAEVADMLPLAQLLLRSSDPAVVSRSKELFMQGMQHAGFFTEDLNQQLENVRISRVLPTPDEGSPESIPLPGLGELKGHWHGTFDASGGGNGDTSADFDFYGEEWEWGTYKTQKVIAVGSYGNNGGLRLEKIFIQKDTATLHADGTLLGPKSNLHFAVLNFPVGLVPPLLQAVQSSTLQPVLSAPLTSIRGILYMEGDLKGPIAKPQCDVQIRLLDGAVGGIELGRAEVVASITSSNRLLFNANFEPAARIGHVHVKGSLPMAPRGVDVPEDDDIQRESIKLERSRSRIRDKSRVNEDSEVEDKRFVWDRLGDEGWEVQLAEGLRGLDWDFAEQGAVQVDATVKDGGMMLITALSPYLNWIQGNADLTLQVRGTADQPTVDGVAAFHKVYISSPVLPRPLSNFGGTIRMSNNQLCVESLDGRVGRKGRLQVKGKLPLKANEMSDVNNIELKADLLEVRAKNIFSGQVDSQMQFTGCLLEPEVSGMIKLSQGEAYLPQDKGASNAASTLASSLQGMAITKSIAGLRSNEATPLTENLRDTPAGNEDNVEEEKEQTKPQIAVRLRGLKLHLGPELRVVYPLILNFAVSGDMELNGLADPHWIKPKGTLTFENGDVNLFATQVRLNRDHPNRAKFEPEQGLDPSLDLALVGADWQLKIQGRARNWQNNLVITSSRSGEPDALTRTEAARVFENQLAGSLLEGDGQLAFKKLAAATVETLMPKIEGKGEFGQARWRLVSAPQIPNLLSLDPTTDPFKSLANLSFGTEVEVQLGKRLQASVVRQLKESEMATQWTLLYQLNNKLRILFSSIPSVDNRLLFEYSATSQS